MLKTKYRTDRITGMNIYLGVDKIPAKCKAIFHKKHRRSFIFRKVSVCVALVFLLPLIVHHLRASSLPICSQLLEELQIPDL